MTLEDLIRKAIEEGRFDGLTLWPSSQGYQSNFCHKGRGGAWRCEVDADPIAAMRRSLGDETATPATDGGVFG